VTQTAHDALKERVEKLEASICARVTRLSERVNSSREAFANLSDRVTMQEKVTGHRHCEVCGCVLASDNLGKLCALCSSLTVRRSTPEEFAEKIGGQVVTLSERVTIQEEVIADLRTRQPRNADQLLESLRDRVTRLSERVTVQEEVIADLRKKGATCSELRGEIESRMDHGNSLLVRIKELEARPIVGVDMASGPDRTVRVDYTAGDPPKRYVEHVKPLETVMLVNMAPEMHDALWALYAAARGYMEDRDPESFRTLMKATVHASIAKADEEKKGKP